MVPVSRFLGQQKESSARLIMKIGDVERHASRNRLDIATGFHSIHVICSIVSVKLRLLSREGWRAGELGGQEARQPGLATFHPVQPLATDPCVQPPVSLRKGGGRGA